MSDSMKPRLLFAAGVLAVAVLLILARDGEEGTGKATPVAAAPVITTRPSFDGTWTAIGRVVYVPQSDNSTQPEGTVLRRPWKFDRVCEAGRCRIAFARGTLYGPSLTWLVRRGGRLTAKFPPVTVPCAYPRGYPYARHASGQSHDSYRLRWSAGGTVLLAIEHRQQTGCYPTVSPPDVTRWRATPNA